jgi:diacylglycerol kinase (ATP)
MGQELRGELLHCAIMTNPVSGGMAADQKRSALARAAEILKADIHGLDTASAEDFSNCARDLASRCQVLVVAGGDGTLSDIINALDTSKTPIGFLPLGTGNAMRHGLKYKGDLADIARRIRDGKIHQFDLISCDEKRRAFIASVGIEGKIIHLWQQARDRGSSGFKGYFLATLRSYFKEYKRANGMIDLDGKKFEAKNLLSLMIMKQPYFGFGMKVMPKARFEDGQLHIRCINSGLLKTSFGILTAFTLGNVIGQYLTGHELTLKLDRPLVLQCDGNEGWEADSFSFKILPKALKIKC